MAELMNEVKINGKVSNFIIQDGETGKIYFIPTRTIYLRLIKRDLFNIGGIDYQLLMDELEVHVKPSHNSVVDTILMEFILYVNNHGVPLSFQIRENFFKHLIKHHEQHPLLYKHFENLFVNNETFSEELSKILPVEDLIIKKSLHKDFKKMINP